MYGYNLLILLITASTYDGNIIAEENALSHSACHQVVTENLMEKKLWQK
tara:strand:+ start:126 stop:272 length:147 start_codon:yes stop_codon:yes gene_type:complete